jgi:hypothetical protein
MGIILPPPPPIVSPTVSPQPRPELMIVAPQRPVQAQTTRAVVGASSGRQGNKAADPDTKRAEDESASAETETAGRPDQGAPAQPKPRGGKVSIEI